MEVHFAKNEVCLVEECNVLWLLHGKSRKVIIQQGDPGTTFYILFEGEAGILVPCTLMCFLNDCLRTLMQRLQSL